LADQPSPKDEQIRRGWSPILSQLDAMSKKWGKPICFTEVGYSASTRAAIEPWKYQVDSRDSDLQARLFKIACEQMASHDSVKGMFVWKWFTSGERRHRDPFAIQDEAGVIDVLREAWKI